MSSKKQSGGDGNSPRNAGFSPFRHGRDAAPPASREPDNLTRLATAKPAPQAAAAAWQALGATRLNAPHLAELRIISALDRDTSANTFDLLRTRMLQALDDFGWRRIIVASPTRGCGATFVAANLALSLARRPSVRTLLVDLELRQPGLASTLGINQVGALQDLLVGDVPLRSHVLRCGDNLALALNARPVANAAELLQEPATLRALEAMQETLEPDVILYDMPAVLSCDDVVAFLPQVDAVLLVADGTRTRAADILRCERLFEAKVPLLGVVLNRAEDPGLDRYSYRGSK